MSLEEFLKLFEKHSPKIRWSYNDSRRWIRITEVGFNEYHCPISMVAKFELKSKSNHWCGDYPHAAHKLGLSELDTSIIFAAADCHTSDVNFSQEVRDRMLACIG